MKASVLLEHAIEWLKSQYPDCIIVTEMSVADWGNARIDVAAITDEEMIGIEIKGEGDSPTRLELQGLRYGQVARKMWILCSPEGTLAERCYKKIPGYWGILEMVDGHIQKRVRYQGNNYVNYFEPRDSRQFNPFAMCETLWRDELYAIARRKNFQPGSRARVSDLTDILVRHLPIYELHAAMIDQLRKRVWKKPVIDLRDPPVQPDHRGSQGSLDI